jgi:S1-C subfamily serine protease
MENSMGSGWLNFAKSARSDLASSSTHSRGFADMSLSVAKRLGFVAVMAFAVGACSQQSSAAPPAQTTAQAQAPVSTPAVGTLNGRALPDFATLVEQVGPAVVNVAVLE